MNKWCLQVIGLLAMTGAVLPAEPPKSQPGRAPGENPPALAQPDSKDGRKTNTGPSREERDKRREVFNKLSPEEREAKRKEIKARLEKRICELKTRQTNTTITAAEVRELERREQILKRFDQAPSQAADQPQAPQK